jgi:hypothetical protein
MCVRSLISNAGWSKKTLRPRGRIMTGGGMAAQVAVGNQGATTLAMRAGGSTNGRAEIE